MQYFIEKNNLVEFTPDKVTSYGHPMTCSFELKPIVMYSKDDNLYRKIQNAISNRIKGREIYNCPFLTLN